MLPSTMLFSLGLLTALYSSSAGTPERSSAPGGQESTPTATPEVYITGLLLRDALNGNDVRISLTGVQPDGVPISTNVPFRFNHGVSFRVRHEYDGKHHDYQAFMNPPDDANAVAIGTVKTASAAGFHIHRGWVLLMGDYPVGETEWGSSTASGTTFAIHLSTHADPDQRVQTIYNLEPEESQHKVQVKLTQFADPIDVAPQERLVCPASVSQPPDPTPIDPADELVQTIRKRAGKAGLSVYVPPQPNEPA